MEISLRAFFGLPRGERLDVQVAGHDVDLKHTMGRNWMIPPEAIDQPCILTAADENAARYYMGLFVAHENNLTVRGNRDRKRGVSKVGLAEVLWLASAHPYPRNFWQTVPEDAVDRIFEGASGNQRVMQLFREVIGRKISRDVVEAVAQQKDFMRRIRADGPRGTRNQLLLEGIEVLSGQYDQDRIRACGYEPLEKSEFIAVRVREGGP